jgi:endonuclease YncB( thermonuclease family)
MIADGDAITVLDSNKEQHRVRLAGTDAPEKGQPFGNASRKRLGELVARKEVRGGMKRAGGNPPGPVMSFSYI